MFDTCKPKTRVSRYSSLITVSLDIWTIYSHSIPRDSACVNLFENPEQILQCWRLIRLIITIYFVRVCMIVIFILYGRQILTLSNRKFGKPFLHT